MSSAAAIVAVRPATLDDAAVVARLAALDGRTAPTGELLLGIVDGEPRAAVAIASGDAVADPFAPTEDLVALVRLRAARLRGDQGRPAVVRRGLRALRTVA